MDDGLQRTTSTDGTGIVGRVVGQCPDLGAHPRRGHLRRNRLAGDAACMPGTVHVVYLWTKAVSAST
jgi:hypothetical protein